MMPLIGARSRPPGKRSLDLIEMRLHLLGKRVQLGKLGRGLGNFRLLRNDVFAGGSALAHDLQAEGRARG